MIHRAESRTVSARSNIVLRVSFEMGWLFADTIILLASSRYLPKETLDLWSLINKSSGTSIKGRTRVHHMANKRLKTLLHMCAISSVSNNEEMKIYFKRKVDEGKNKMLVLNAIRNKILARVFSCVKNKRMYEPYFA